MKDDELLTRLRRLGSKGSVCHLAATRIEELLWEISSHKKPTLKEAMAVMREHNYDCKKYEGYGTPGGRDPMG